MCGSLLGDNFHHEVELVSKLMDVGHKHVGFFASGVVTILPIYRITVRGFRPDKFRCFATGYFNELQPLGSSEASDI